MASFNPARLPIYDLLLLKYFACKITKDKTSNFSARLRAQVRGKEHRKRHLGYILNYFSYCIEIKASGDDKPLDFEGYVIECLRLRGTNDAKPMPLRLTQAAEDDRADFHRRYDMGGNCSCHMGHAPCGSCTHPGNPRNQDEDEECWEVNDVTLHS